MLEAQTAAHSHKAPSAGGVPVLTSDDYDRLLRGLPATTLAPYDELGRAIDDGRGAIGLRLDLTTGLTRDALALARIEDAAGVTSLKALSMVAAETLSSAST